MLLLFLTVAALVTWPGSQALLLTGGGGGGASAGTAGFAGTDNSGASAGSSGRHLLAGGKYLLLSLPT